MTENPFTESSWFTKPFNDDWTVSSLLQHSTLAHAKNPALITDANGITTHQEIAELSASVRGAIMEVVNPECAVACMTPLDLTCFVSIHATLTSGRVFTALDVQSPRKRNLQCLEECRAELILASTTCREEATLLSAESGIPLLFIEELFERPPSPPSSSSGYSPAVYVFTSGSRGRPKAVVRNHRDLAHSIYCFSKMYRYVPQDRMMFPGSPGHVGTLNDALITLICGLCAIPIDISKVEINRMAMALGELQVTFLSLPPSLLRVLLPAIDQQASNLSLRTVLTSGEALYRVDIAQFFNSRLKGIECWQNYGSTETGPIAAGQYVASDAEGPDPLPLQHMHHSCQVEVIHDEDTSAEDNSFGKLLIRSKYLAPGYLNPTPELAAKFISNPDDDALALFLGDQGRISATGDLQVSGRSDYQINIHGRRYESGEIEAALLGHEDVLEATVSVVSSPSEPQRQTLCAAVSPQPGKTIDAHALRLFLEEKLPPAAIPSRILPVHEMPKTSAGKADRVAIDRILREHPEVEVRGTGGPPRGIVENWIADCWQEILKIPRPGRHERLQDLGGDSLLALELMLMLEQRFQIQLDIDELAAQPSIAAQAKAMDNKAQGTGTTLITFRDDEEGPHILFIPGLGGHAWNYHEMSKHISSPCKIQAVSLERLFSSLGANPSRTDVASKIISCLPKSSRGRPLFIGGYSLGGIIACDVANQLPENDFRLQHVLLIDPAQPRKLSLFSAAKRRVERLREDLSNSVISAARIRKIESRFLKIEKMQRRTYRNADIELPETDFSIALTSETAKTFNNSALGKRMKPLSKEPFLLDASHLEIMQHPQVMKTANWVDQLVQQMQTQKG